MFSANSAPTRQFVFEEQPHFTPSPSKDHLVAPTEKPFLKVPKSGKETEMATVKDGEKGSAEV